MEHFYEKVAPEQPWFDFADFYMMVVDWLPDGSHFVEVGSWKGRSSVFMGVEILNSGKKIKFDCVDHWKGSPEHQENGIFYDPMTADNSLYNEFLKNIEPLKDLITPVRMSSVEASKLYEDESLDFVFIDAEHSYEAVKIDIDSWLPKIRTGGIISGHDFYSGGVAEAVKEFFHQDFTQASHECWYHIKK